MVSLPLVGMTSVQSSSSFGRACVPVPPSLLHLYAKPNRPSNRDKERCARRTLCSIGAINRGALRLAHRAVAVHHTR